MSLSASAPWLNFYGSIPKTIDYPRLTMYRLIEQTAKSVPNSVAYEFMGKKPEKGPDGSDIYFKPGCFP